MSQSARPRWTRALLVATVATASLVLPVAVASPAAAAGSILTPITPTRVLDADGAQAPRFGAGETRLLDLSAVVPSGATAVALNLTADGATAGTYLTVWPAGVARPLASNLNATRGQTRANAVMVGVGADRTVAIFNLAGSVRVVVDVMGYTTSGFTGVTPARLLDTREPGQGGAFGPTEARSLTVAGVAGVPSSAAGVVLNVTAVSPTAPGFLTVWPAGGPRPGTSNLNFVPGDVVPNLVTVGVGTQGQVSIYSLAGRVDVVVDILGWFDASGFTPLVTPGRLLDTREGTCGYTLGPGETRTLRVTESVSVSAVSLNVTAVNPTAGSYLTVWPAGSARPTSSNLNVAAGQAPTPNLVTVGVGPAGEVNIFNYAGTVDVVVDLFGTFAGTTPAGTPTPCPSLSPGGGAALVAEPALLRTVGADRVAVWVCRVPFGSVDSFYGPYGSSRAPITLEGATAVAASQVAPYFASVSRGRYVTVFEAVGYIDLTVDEGPQECLDRAEAGTRSNPAGQMFTNVLAFDDSPYTGGFAGPGLISLTPGRTGRQLSFPPADTGRGAWVGGGAAEAFPSQLVIAHEIGHTLHWPHSYIGPDSEYDNPIDLMSGEPEGAWCSTGSISYPCKAQQTIAFNRLAAGWIDDNETAVHRGGTSTVQLAAPQQPGLQILFATDPDSPGAVLTLEARPQVGYDAVLDSAGVAVHIIDQRGLQCASRIGGACVSLWRRQGQAMGAPFTDQHVVAVGSSVAVSGVTIRVDAAVNDSYRVTVTGTFDADATVLTPEVAGLSVASEVEVLASPARR